MGTEKLVTIKSVKQAISKLQSQGNRPSNRNIRQVLGGGSPNDIQSILQQIEDAEGAGVLLPTELPEHLQNIILKGINSLVTDMIAGLQKQAEKIKADRMEVLDELEQALKSIENLKVQQERLLDCSKAEQQLIKDLEKQIGELKIERQQLIEAGEVARTASAKAQLQLDRADRTLEKCESRLAALEEKIETEREARHAAEIRAASAEALAKTSHK